MYIKHFFASWADMDFNGHMRNTAFLDRAADVRMMFFSEHGFSMQEFMKRRFGPVVLRDEVDYAKEIQLLQGFTVGLQLAGLANDGSRFLMRNTFHRSDGKQCAVVTSAGVWLDLDQRRPISPPTELYAALINIEKAESFRELEPLSTST